MEGGRLALAWAEPQFPALGHPSWDRGHSELRGTGTPCLGTQKEPQGLLNALGILSNIRIAGPWLFLNAAVTTGVPGRGRELRVWFVHKNLGGSLWVTGAALSTKPGAHRAGRWPGSPPRQAAMLRCSPHPSPPGTGSAPGRAARGSAPGTRLAGTARSSERGNRARGERPR